MTSDSHKRRFGFRQAATCLLIGGLTLVGSFASAGVRDANVVRGEAEIVRNGNQITIHAGNGSIIEYSRFNIGANEAVRFIQPGADARVLNRILGGDPSKIEGTLQANGIVYLVNPAGVYFMPGATVDVAQLYAVAGNLNNLDFVSGRDLFTNLRGEVVNHGQIQAHAVHLLGREVANLGSISVPDGVVTMLAGDRAFLQVDGTNVHIELDGKALTDQGRPHAGQSDPSLDGKAGVNQAGTINAGRGRVALGAGDMYALAVRHAGQTNAAGGDVSLTAADGAIDQSGSINVSVDQGQAGSITVQGPSVMQRGTLRADAAHGQAGSIEVTSQHHTVLPDGSVISAAGGEGAADGGFVLVHSYDGSTTFHDDAMVDVSSGELGGEGGFAEVSGMYLVFRGNVNLGGVDGAGLLLIDPRDITIVGPGQGTDDSMLDGSNQIAFNDNAASDIAISVTKLQSLEGHIHLQALRDLLVNHELDLTGNGANLHLEAGRDLSINATLTLSPDALLQLEAGRDLAFNAPTQAGSILAYAGLDDSAGLLVTRTGSITGTANSLLHGPRIMVTEDLHLGGLGWQLNGPVDGFVGLGDAAPDLTIAGNVIFANSVGQLSPVGNLHVGGTADIGGQIVTTAGDQTYNGTVIVRGNTQFHARMDPNSNDIIVMDNGAGSTPLGTVTFGQSVFQSEATPVNITVDAHLVLHGDLGETEAPLNTLLVQGATTFHNSEVRTLGNQSYMGATTLAGNTNLYSQNQDVVFFGAVNGPHTLNIEAGRAAGFVNNVGQSTPLAALTLQADELIVLYGQLVRTTGDLRLNPNGRTDVPTVATIASDITRSNVQGIGVTSLTLQSVDGSVTMGQHEKLTALNNLTILAGDTATLGDVNTLGHLTVDANTIEVRTRQPGEVMVPMGGGSFAFLMDDGVDIIAGGELRFSTTPTPIGDYAGPLFASAATNPDPNSQLQTVQTIESLTRSRLYNGQYYFDLRLEAPPVEPIDPITPTPPGPGFNRINVNLASSLPENASPVDTDVAMLEQLLLSPAAREALAQLQVQVLPPDPQATAQVVDDIDSTPTAPRLSSTRVNSRAAMEVVNAYLALFGTDGDTAAPINENAPALRQQFEQAWAAYQADADAADPGAMLAYLQQDEALVTAAQQLATLRQMVNGLARMGLTSAEYRGVRSMLLEQLRPENMTADQFTAAVLGITQLTTPTAGDTFTPVSPMSLLAY